MFLQRLVEYVILEEDETWQTTDGFEFWGSAGAGILCVAEDTQRILLTLRSGEVDQPHTWGLPGGAMKKGQTPSQAAKIELREETGYGGKVRIVPAFVFTKGSFKFYNFIGYVPNEFTPKLDWENDDAGWFSFKKLPTPLHFGVQSLLANTKPREILAGLDVR